MVRLVFLIACCLNVLEDRSKPSLCFFLPAEVVVVVVVVFLVVVVVVVVVHLDSRNVRNRVTVLHVLPPTLRVAQIF